MSIVFYFLGMSLALFVIVDLIWTTFWVDGGSGPLSDSLTTLAWKLIKKINHKRLYNLAGPIILTLTLFSWFFLLWVGVTLFFAGNPEAIVNNTTNQTASWTELIYYSGFTLFTLGIGDFTPQTAISQITTSLVAGMGMMLLTFGASYVISVVSAVVEKRAFARSVSGLGATSTELLLNIWNGQDFFEFDLILARIDNQITKLTQQNQAFPLLQYYHSENPEKTSAVNIAILDEALTILEHGVKNKEIMNQTLIKAARSTIENYTDTVLEGYGSQVEEIKEIPSIPNLSNLFKTSIPLTTQENFAKEIKKLDNRRNNLLKNIVVDNHKWPSN